MEVLYRIALFPEGPPGQQPCGDRPERIGEGGEPLLSLRGTVRGGSTSVQPYRYNGKEFDHRLGLNMYDYGVHHYDAALGRWFTVDPRIEDFYSWSPYNYCYNNPIKFIDPDGEGPTIPYSQIFSFGQNEKYGHEAAKIGLRYTTPIEEGVGLVTGNNFDGNPYNRAEATAYMAMGFVPFGKILGNAGKLVKVAFKYSDEVADLVKTTGKYGDEAKEIITVTKSGKLTDAMEVSKDIVGDLGKDVKDALGKFDYQKGKIVGKVLNDGSKGYRIDFDKQKGAILIDTSEYQVRRIVDNEIMKNEEIIKNGFLRELSSFMEVLSDDYPNYFYNICNKFSIPINQEKNIRTNIAWNNVFPKFSFFYDFINNEDKICNWMTNSIINTSEKIIVELGYNLPIIKVDTQVFLKNWENFIAASGFLGITCISEDGNYFFEFTDDSEAVLYSNFLILKE